jgi:hypothetical protein
MPDLKTEFIPLLPLNNGVVLPNMVVTIPLERDEAQAAVAAAREGPQHLLHTAFGGRGARRTGDAWRAHLTRLADPGAPVPRRRRG